MEEKKIYSDKQADFYERCLEGENIFLTGKAGTGKTFIVHEVMDEMRRRGHKFIAIAPTGVAANNVGGQTMHSMFGLGISGVQKFGTCNFLKGGKRKVIEKAKTIFIDEASMCRPDHIDALNWTMKKNGLGKLSDKQIVFIGDMKQLPAPIDDNTMSVLLETYGGFTFDQAIVYKSISPKTIDLDVILRQTDEAFINALNIIRDGGRSQYFKDFVSDKARGIVLAPHNSTVANYNEKGLEALPGKKYHYEAIIHGNAKAHDFKLESSITLKDGAKIMYLVNSKDNPLYNGSIGIFRIEDEEPYIEIEGTRWLIEEVEFEKKAYVFNDETNELELKKIGSICQIPVRLAYALSIHKSQGLTFDEITVDLSRPCFSKGQLYTALSRVRTPEGLTIKIE